ncbi:amidase [Salipaludibacillus keqinensis]|uniref:Amidase n=1 Tax=Salipaludibacillus keqinensis TaxID=2045207 RepID=A0A323TJK0_9BACI|nr:amidase [Salipaludibacillus keqinensis]PYZ94740.1 amidase [Salipaludibacillus keqinensis]
MSNTFHAFSDFNVVKEPIEEGPLSGLTFTVKDVFHLKGIKNTAGNPDWYETHEAAEQTAPAITSLLLNGGKLSGTTITDELMYSLQGENAHYGTPINPTDPTRIPGGSSSGSAVSVAAEITDFSLGTDTGGSVRIPAAYCGLYGFRPTHDHVPIDQVIPLAPSFDTVGWMARNSRTLHDVGEVLLGKTTKQTGFSRVMVSQEAWSLADEDTQQALSPFLSKLEIEMGKLDWIAVSEEGLDVWANAFRLIQGKEIWDTHGTWVKATKPRFGPGIKDRFQMASQITSSEVEPQIELRKRVKQHLLDLLQDDGLLIIPTVPGVAPKLNLPDEVVEERRKRTLQLSCIAGLAGLPQLTIPLKEESGLPVGLSIIAGPGQDLSLLKWVDDLTFKGEKR